MENKQKCTKSAGGIVINNNNKVLVVNQNGRSWSLPKGHIEMKESKLEAARREIFEESGIKDLKFIKSIGKYKRYKIAKDGGDDKSELKTIYMFLFKTSKNILGPIDPENPEAKWIDKNKVVDLLTHYKDKEFFLRIKEEI